MKIMVISGPSINMLGIREPEIYGKRSYKELVGLISTYCSLQKIDLTVFQSNHEGEIIDQIQKAYFEKYDGIVINAGAYTHTSIAIADALRSVSIPTIEVHLTDPDTRENYRRINYIKPCCFTTVKGLGIDGYLVAIIKLSDLKKGM